ncbi:hypothetical protein M9458_019245, partial [Cirrhinus mrigala]
ELSGSINDPAPLLTGMEADLFYVMTKAMDELGLEWSPPEEPSCSCLDEWLLPVYCQAPTVKHLAFFLEVHNELTRSWHTPYSVHLRTSSTALTSVDGAEEKV